MRRNVPLPSLGDGVEAATVLEWICDVGDEVQEGQGLVSVELEKTDTVVASPFEGTVVERLVQPGEEVTVGTPLCVLEGE